MDREIDLKELERACGKRVEVIAFSLSYTGLLKGVDWEKGTIQVVDREDKAVLEIERITSFKILEG
ncbi:MAG: hypothetical protein HYS22_06475 [Deltaproteobacteria bacterium]|nr:hypothetical protein [Deltaproteobacteria bacterium]